MNIRTSFGLRALRILTLTALAFFGYTASAAAAPGETTDLKITKTASAGSVKVGESVTYTIVTSNLGPVAATDVTVVDQLPKGANLVSATSTAGNCASAGNKVTCKLGNIAVGTPTDDSSVTTIIKVILSRAGTVTNTATVSADEKDSIKTNNQASVKTTVIAPSSAPTCRGVAATIVGTAGADQLVGTPGRDVVASFAGADSIATFSGRDLVCAGKGNDYVLAGTDDDRVFGSDGRDRLIGRAGNDLLKGNAGNDVLKGNRGRDRLLGGSGFDLCRGGAGPDLLRSCER